MRFRGVPSSGEKKGLPGRVVIVPAPNLSSQQARLRQGYGAAETRLRQGYGAAEPRLRQGYGAAESRLRQGFRLRQGSGAQVGAGEPPSCGLAACLPRRRLERRRELGSFDGGGIRAALR